MAYWRVLLPCKSKLVPPFATEVATVYLCFRAVCGDLALPIRDPWKKTCVSLGTSEAPVTAGLTYDGAACSLRNPKAKTNFPPSPVAATSEYDSGVLKDHSPPSPAARTAIGVIGRERISTFAD
ncbi:ethylene-responsive transcription factor 12-like [Neltuma alba]|uniref:ethylene-responsive transcription factor 12-like n=1 Tax=Neltuma alba TaxID=207710 RepID=UPI0010A2C064|nr:ethylene-responsive transcription factor 12-like [Prosopis alba]